MSAQDETLDRYHALMRVNAEAHVLRGARDSGILRHLLAGQATAAQLSEALGLEPTLMGMLLDALVAMKVVEKYEDDYALAAVTRLMCQYDGDLGDDVWGQLLPQLRGASGGKTSHFHDSATATQWIHTGAAKQAAELLDIGGFRSGKRILDWGCGSAVWSAAMAFVDPGVQVTAVDLPERIAAAQRTVESIELADRYQLVAADPQQWQPEPGAFDLIVVAGRFASSAAAAERELLKRLQEGLADDGELAIIDLFRGPANPSVNEAIEALKLAVATEAGRILEAQEVRQTLLEVGFADCQFAFLSASRQGWGLMLATRKG